MNKFLITLSTLNIFDLYFLLLHAVENINKNPQLAERDFTPEGLLKIKSIYGIMSKELLHEVKIGKHREQVG